MRSPLHWIGGKFYSASRILAAFPPASSYDVYVEPFGGAAHVLSHKDPGKHIEIYNDIYGDLVNFWLCCRDQPDALQKRLETLPYARALYYLYHDSLRRESMLSDLERAARWYYVLRASFVGRARFTSAPGWDTSSKRNAARTYYNVLELFEGVAERFRNVQIDNRDFEKVIRLHESPRTFFYCDPPYVGKERYYRSSTSFTPQDQRRLATILNETSAQVALSTYDHPKLDEWYPRLRWRRIAWSTYKHSQRTRAKHEKAIEMLLMNYQTGEAAQRSFL